MYYYCFFVVIQPIRPYDVVMRSKFLFSCLIFVLSVVVSRAQSDQTNYVAHYLLTHSPQNIIYQYKERMVLLMGDTYNQFKSYDRFKRDSILLNQASQGGPLHVNFSHPDIPRYTSTQQIIKETAGSKGYVSDWLIVHYFWDYNWPKLEWTLHKDTATIAGYPCQKATTTSPSTGWEWTVWFTSDLPISSGPQLLEGLPGLIVQAWDNQGRTHYELSSFGSPTDSFKEIALPKDAFKTTQQDFARAQAMSNEDPHGYVNQSGLFQGKISGISVKDANGKEMKTIQQKKEAKKGGNK
jgi:GLPGLI family protein